MNKISLGFIHLLYSSLAIRPTSVFMHCSKPGSLKYGSGTRIKDCIDTSTCKWTIFTYILWNHFYFQGTNFHKFLWHSCSANSNVNYICLNFTHILWNHYYFWDTNFHKFHWHSCSMNSNVNIHVYMLQVIVMCAHSGIHNLEYTSASLLLPFISGV